MESLGRIESPATPFTVASQSSRRSDDDDDDDDIDDDDFEAELDFSDFDEEDEEEEAELEPCLKYERLGNDLAHILGKDAASAMAVHPKFVALGTHWGVIHILDPQGNNIVGKEINAHTTTVNQISIDAAGDHIASCSDDGRVVITGMYNNEGNRFVNLDRPVKAVALDPNFSRQGASRRYVSGDDKLVLNEKGIFSTNRSFVLHQGEGPIRNIKWRSDLIAWSNDLGVKIYDMTSKQRITFIARDHSPELRPELYRCNLCWKDDTTLIVGWGDTIKVCEIRSRPKAEMETHRDLPNRFVAIVAMFATEFFVCGVAPLGADQIVVLSYDDREPKMEAGKPVSSRPHIRILKPSMNSFEEISNDALSIRGFSEYRCNDYHLEFVDEDVLYYIVSPKDVVLGKLRDQDDHVDWLLAHDEYKEALDAVQRHGRELKRHNYQDISREYIKYLLEEGYYEDAALQCSLCLKTRPQWEEQVYTFARIGQLKIIAPYLPKGGARLDPAVYEMVLGEFLQTDPFAFAAFLREWPADLYHIPTIVNAIWDRMEIELSNDVLLECLALLYTKESRFDKALEMYLRLRNEQVFVLIKKHNLFHSIVDKVVELFELDKDKTLKLLLDGLDQLPLDKIVSHLRRRRDLYFLFLDKLNKKDPLNQSKLLRTEHYDDLVMLFAEFDQSRLLQYLKSTTFYDLTKSAERCYELDLVVETIYLYGRMGNLKHALALIMNSLKDVEMAIEFCKEHDDPDLWEDLVEHAIDKPKFVVGLLQNIGTHVDPIILIQRIKEGMEIEGLQKSLVKILHDYNLQISLLEGCQKILVNDSFNLFQRHVKIQKKGISVSDFNCCQICHSQLIGPPPPEQVVPSADAGGPAGAAAQAGGGAGGTALTQTDLVVFNCGHSFHVGCLDVIQSCFICSNQKRLV